LSQKLRTFLSLAKRDELLALREPVDAGTLTPPVGSTYSLNDGGAAIRQAGSGRARGNVVVTVSIPGYDWKSLAAEPPPATAAQVIKPRSTTHCVGCPVISWMVS
jgi:hypothetical protein